MEWVIQYMAEEQSESSALEAFEHHKQQDGFLGGRILSPGPTALLFRVQVFFAGNGEHPLGWLPEGLRHVCIPASQRKALGLT